MLNRIRNAAADRVNRFVVLADEVEQLLRGPEDDTAIRAIVYGRDELAGQVHTLTAECARLRRENLEIDAAYAELDGRAKAERNRASAAEAQLSQKTREAADLRTRVECSEARETATHKERDRLAGEVGVLHRALSDSQAEVARLKRAKSDDLAGLAEHASKPEPAPLNEGEPVTPLLLDWLAEQAKNASGVAAVLFEDVATLIKKRDAFGRLKYGQPLRLNDGRNTVEDAEQEAGDLLQYLFKAYKNGEDVRRLSPALYWIGRLFAVASGYGLPKTQTPMKGSQP
jgi:hypothetical protein